MAKENFSGKKTSAGEKQVRKAYSSPTILSRELLESVADVCSSTDSKEDATQIALDGGGVCGYEGGVFSS